MGNLRWLTNRPAADWGFDSCFRLIQGAPAPTAMYTAAELARMGLVGVYTPDPPLSGRDQVGPRVPLGFSAWRDARAWPQPCAARVDVECRPWLWQRCGRLAWGRPRWVDLRHDAPDGIGQPRCPEHGGPQAPPHCRACSRLLPLDCCSEECGHEPLCEVCGGWAAAVMAHARFLGDLDRALAAALDRMPEAEICAKLLGPP